MNKFFEKKVRKYVIATLGNPTMYLYKTVGNPEYKFVDNIEMATKTIKKNVSEMILNYYRIDTGLDTELVVIPIDITYEIIEE